LEQQGFAQGKCLARLLQVEGGAVKKGVHGGQAVLVCFEVRGF
jgi:hypothetical protein